ncbi:MAG TPA: tripartite tricarboxylate transporter substrate binding protein [Ottowia sp.]|uniref:Bug family tripartite tricarboxylate transporter substrate binding protein n=1 Tax=Ottowia sp. TaxID=1898956 RepID=UPI002CE5F382|nr:tripartite tricarboxylate transporter substrate binding protein [Ottowia sp.]HRN05374.1 tripartite tricarboxylate transporter substrate binding protein [Ottowia sp.]
MHQQTPLAAFALTRRRALLATGALLAAGGAGGQSWPAKPIKLVVPWPPGGPTDTGSRIFGLALADRLGQPVVVENRPGASGSIAYQQVIKTPGDGTTFVMLATPTMLAPHLYKSASYHPVNDLLPVGMVYDLPIVLVVNAASLPKVTDLAGLIAEAKSRGGKLDYTSAGPGSFGHLSMEMLKHQGGFDAQHIAYKGSAPAMNDLLGGQVPVMFSDLVAALPHIKSGKLRALAVGSPKRVDIVPDVKTVAEQGFKGFEAVSIGAMMAPKGAPAAAIDRMSSELKAVLAQKDVQDRLVGAGCYAHYMTPAETGRYVTAEFDKWGKVIKDNKLTVE